MEPPQTHAAGGRRALDRRWLTYLRTAPPDCAALAPAPALVAGVALFNHGRFLEAHEAWEEVWRRECGGRC